MRTALETVAILQGVTATLSADRPIAERLEALVEQLVPSFCDRCALVETDEPSTADSVLEIPTATGSALRLERAAGWDELDREIAGEVAARVSIAVDIDRRLAAVALNEEFLATLSHELRTPLHVVVGWADMLRRGQLAGEKQQRALELIDRNAQVQVRLVDDLLDASRIVSGRLQLDVEDVVVADSIDAAIESLAPTAEEMDVALVLELERDLRSRADPVRLTQMIHNLVGNALKFTPGGGKVIVKVAADGDRIAVSVTDTGSGIEPEMLPRLFDRFWQGQRQRLARSRGLGLGLFITKSLAELQGGEIAAESAGPGTGSRFTFWLPRLG